MILNTGQNVIVCFIIGTKESEQFYCGATHGQPKVGREWPRTISNNSASELLRARSIYISHPNYLAMVAGFAVHMALLAY